MRLLVRASLAIGWVLLLSSPSQGAEHPLITVGQSWQQAQLLAIDAQGNLALQAEKQQFVKSLDQLVRFGHPAKPSSRYVHVFLIDGSRLVGFLEKIDRTTLQLDCISLGLIDLNRRYLKAIVFQPPTDEQRRIRLETQLLQSEAQSDELWLANGDTISGEFGDLRLQGLEPVVQFETPVGEITLKASQIRAAGLATSARIPSTDRQAWVGFTDGSLFLAKQLSTSEDAFVLRPTLSSSHTWKASKSQLCFLQPLTEKVTYLSELSPVTYRHIPFLETKRPFHKDLNCLGRPLQANGEVYLRGIGMPTTALLVYRIPDGAKQFAAQLALDDAATPSGSVIFRVLVDGKPQFTSPVIRPGKPPQPIAVDVAGASTLTLVTLFAERGDASDYANWLDARFER